MVLATSDNYNYYDDYNYDNDDQCMVFVRDPLLLDIFSCFGDPAQEAELNIKKIYNKNNCIKLI